MATVQSHRLFKPEATFGIQPLTSQAGHSILILRVLKLHGPMISKYFKFKAIT